MSAELDGGEDAEHDPEDERVDGLDPAGDDRPARGAADAGVDVAVDVVVDRAGAAGREVAAEAGPERSSRARGRWAWRRTSSHRRPEQQRDDPRLRQRDVVADGAEQASAARVEARPVPAGGAGARPPVRPPGRSDGCRRVRLRLPRIPSRSGTRRGGTEPATWTGDGRTCRVRLPGCRLRPVPVGRGLVAGSRSARSVAGLGAGALVRRRPQPGLRLRAPRVLGRRSGTSGSRGGGPPRGCRRSGSALRTSGTRSKLWTGGGEGANHSSVLPVPRVGAGLDAVACSWRRR